MTNLCQLFCDTISIYWALINVMALLKHEESTQYYDSLLPDCWVRKLISCIYASANWLGIGSVNSLSPIRRQAITWTNAVVNRTLRNKCQWNLNRNTFFHKNAFENVVCEMGAILSRREKSKPVKPDGDCDITVQHCEANITGSIHRNTP